MFVGRRCGINTNDDAAPHCLPNEFQVKHTNTLQRKTKKKKKKQKSLLSIKHFLSETF